MTEAVAADDLDFLGNGSMKDIAMKMGDIEKVLAELSTELDDTPKSSSTSSRGDDDNKKRTGDTAVRAASNDNIVAVGAATTATAASYEESATSLLSDGDVYADDTNTAVSDMQKELAAFDELERQAKAEREAAAKKRQECIAARTTTRGTVEGSDKTSITVTVTKPDKSSPLGMSMKTSKGVTRIVSIMEHGLLAGSGLQEANELVEINGTAIKNAKHARHIIQAAPTDVKIVVHFVEVEK